MAPRYMSDSVKLLLTVLLMFVISKASTKHCTSKKTEGDDYVIRNIGIKLCQLKCSEHGQCVSIDYDAKTLTCRLSRVASRIEKKEGHVIPARSQSHVPTGSCASSMCSFGQRCLKTRSGKEVCVQASTDPSPNTLPPAPVTTYDIQASTTDACEDLTPSKTVPPASVTTQDSDPHATPSLATDRDLYDESTGGNLERVKRILAAGHVNIDTRGDFSRTPVMAAVQHRHWDVVELLLGKGADVSLVDKFGDNILHYACLVGHMKTVTLILSLHKVDVNSRGQNRRTPVMATTRNGRRDLVEFLVVRGADVSLVDKYGDNVLHLACRVGDQAIVKLILSLNKVDINARNNKGKTAADVARFYRHQQVVDLLVSRDIH